METEVYGKAQICFYALGNELKVKSSIIGVKNLSLVFIRPRLNSSYQSITVHFPDADYP